MPVAFHDGGLSTSSVDTAAPQDSSSQELYRASRALSAELSNYGSRSGSKGGSRSDSKGGSRSGSKDVLSSWRTGSKDTIRKGSQDTSSRSSKIPWTVQEVHPRAETVRQSIAAVPYKVSASAPLFAVLLGLLVCFGILAGAHGAWYLNGEIPISPWLWYCFLLVATIVVSLFVTGPVIGSPNMGPGRRHFTVAASLWCVLVSFTTLVWLQWLSDDLMPIGIGFFSVWTALATTVGLRGAPLRVMAISAICASAARGLLITDGFEDTDPPLVFGCVVVLLSSCTRYLRDQRLVCTVGLQPTMAYAMGILIVRLETDPGLYVKLRIGAYALLSAVLACVNYVMRRRRRHLPHGLTAAKFVRLGYLRMLASSGERMSRCQELPDYAFGDPSRARHFIVTSHRWLHPHTCDVACDEFPQGIKLSRLLERLEVQFSVRAAAGACSRWSFRGLFDALCVGGWDVVIFFDYMCVPQPGIDDVGAVIPRTSEEKAVFDDCLPNMGTLYSMFPVLTLTDVPEGGALQYEDSGWCFCEFVIAILGKRLHLYSSETVRSPRLARFVEMCQTPLDGRSAADFGDVACRQLAAMHFFQSSDRAVAQGIIKGFLRKRLLADAIRGRQAEDVRRILMELQAEGLGQTLDAPIDDMLNTLLHLSIQCSFPEATRALLAAGAQSLQKNSRGDYPHQLFSLPVLSAAARASRAHAGRLRKETRDRWLRERVQSLRGLLGRVLKGRRWRSEPHGQAK